MLSKSQVSFIKSLHQKKYRKQHGLFIVEGIKSIQDFLNSHFVFHSIYASTQYYSGLNKLASNIKLFEVNNAEIEKISTLQNPQGILALIELPENVILDTKVLKNTFTLMLDDVQDPGNLGTIIRTADWFGIKKIICSQNTADAFNPKTVQATMGSLSRVNVYYTDLAKVLASTAIPVFGAMLEGENIYKINWGSEGIILLGNEGQGISEKLINEVSRKVTIPQVGKAESLNVAISAAIFCSELRRA